LYYQNSIFFQLQLPDQGLCPLTPLGARVIFGVRFERQKVDKKANLHEN